jgi:hypothetical protein
VAAPPQRVTIIGATLLLAAVAVGLFALRHRHDDVRRNAGRLMGCAASEVEVERLPGDGVERYRVQGCGGGGIMTCKPTDPVCFIVPEAL